MNGKNDHHARNSVLREVILEHLLIAELLRHYWGRSIFDVEILRSEFDAGGYDLVMTRGNLIRHVQLKTKILEATTREVTISQRLATRKSGCIVCIAVDKDLRVDHFLVYGNSPDEPLPQIQHLKTAKHTRANSDGFKAERPDFRRVPLKQFTRVSSVEELANFLLGP